MNFIKKISSQNPLFFAFLFPAFLDMSLTFIGQHSSQAQMINEASPAYYFLLVSPYFFLFGSVLWLIIWYFIFLKVNNSLKLFLSIFFIISHSWGSASWLWKLARENNLYYPQNQLSIILIWSLVIFYFTIIAYLTQFCLIKYFQNKK